MADKTTKKKTNTSLWDRMMTKVVTMTVCGMALVTVVSLVYSITRFRNDINEINNSYLYDVTEGYGKAAQLEYNLDSDFLDDYDKLNELLAGVGIDGQTSSYAYIVDNTGIMLYHPTADKVGNAVENSVVKGLVEQLQAGKIPTNDCVSYEYKGATKLAGYYVEKTGAFVLVVCADYNDINASTDSIRNNSIYMALGVLLACCLFALYLCNHMFSPLQKSTDDIVKLANLDLSDVTVIKRKDEPGQISAAVKSLRDNLYAMVSTINGISSKLGDNATTFITSFGSITESLDNVDKSVLEIAQGATSQAQETVNSSEQVQGINMALEANNNTVSQLKDSAEQMSSMATTAVRELDALVASCDKQKDSITILSEQTMQTNDSATAIQDAVSMITSIASQTNLLSLNASIEAARAGEAGKGFAVVADEIRALSESSKESADTISDIVAELIRNSQISVNTIKQVEANTEEQLARLADTQSSFNSLIEEIKSVDDNTDTVAQESGRLSTLNANISSSIEQLSAISEEYAATTQETSANMQTVNNEVAGCVEISEGLKNLSSELIDQMSKFSL